MEKVTFWTLFLGFFLTSTSVFSQSTYNYTGQVGYQNNIPLSGVIVTLQFMNGDIIATDTSDNTGTYEFTDVATGNYIVTFYTDQPAGGVELEDASMILDYLDGEIEFSSIQEMAADVNGNGVINMGDHQQIVNQYLNHGQPFPVGPWVFENDTITISEELRDGTGTMKLGSSSGDVNGSLQPDPKQNPIFLETPIINLDQAVSMPIEFSLSASEHLLISGMHLAFRIPEGLNIMSIESPVQNLIYSTRDGILRITCIDYSQRVYEISAGNPVVKIITEAITATDDACSYRLALCDESHFLDANGKLASGLKLNLPVINILTQQNLRNTTYPNPFISNITFEYELLQEGVINIVVSDQYGRQIREVNERSLGIGVHQYRFDGSSLAPGIYHYCIRVSGQNQQVANGIMIKSK